MVSPIMATEDCATKHTQPLYSPKDHRGNKNQGTEHQTNKMRYQHLELVFPNPDTQMSK